MSNSKTTPELSNSLVTPNGTIENTKYLLVFPQVSSRRHGSPIKGLFSSPVDIIGTLILISVFFSIIYLLCFHGNGNFIAKF